MLKVQIGEKEYTLHKEYESVYLNQQPLIHAFRRLDEFTYQVQVGNTTYTLYTAGIHAGQDALMVRIRGKKAIAQFTTQKQIFLKMLGIDTAAGQKIQDLKAPMPGLIRSIPIVPGQNVQKGQTLLVLEAMKMENALKAPGEGTVKEIVVQVGQAVEKNQLLIIFE